MQRWRIEGFRGDTETLSRHVTGAEKKVRVLLERLAARHLTEDEVIEATLGSRNDLLITKDAGCPLRAHDHGYGLSLRSFCGG